MRELAIDLGTTNTIILEKGSGILLDEPSVIAINATTKELVEIGAEAEDMISRVHGNINALHPIKNGVITDFENTNIMLKHFMVKAKVAAKFTNRPRVLLAIPTEVSRVEKLAVVQILRAVGVKRRDIFLINKAKATALSEKLPIEKPQGCMIVDIGGGTTETLIMSMNETVSGKSVPIAGDELDTAIVNYIKKQYNTAIADYSAEAIKIELGCAFQNDSKKTYEVKGLDLTSNATNTLTITANEVATAIEEPIKDIIDSIKRALEKTPPELAADIMQMGIILTGGGSLLKGLSRLIAEEIGVEIKTVDKPLNSVINGMALVLDDFANMQHLLTAIE
ncbi:MAG: rod shape-determining protein [Defluviitaleaceae bacterium]|nr:rod shape-determining protein [Defluviitaleaceae bacterium]